MAKAKTRRGGAGGGRAGDRSDKTLHYGSFESPIGTVYVAADGKKVVLLSFTSASEADFLEELSGRTSRTISRSNAAVKPAIDELREYFGGKRKKFTLAPDVSGHTRFQEKVLKAAMSIPHGQTQSYAWLAKQGGSPKAARAAGQVMAHNPVPIIIPCHRVLGSSGDLCGFAGGLRAFGMKKNLLEIEGIRVQAHGKRLTAVSKQTTK